MDKTIALVRTLYNKGDEIGFLKTLGLRKGYRVIIADTAILGKPDLQADISRHEIAISTGSDFDTFKKRGDEAFAQKIISDCLKKIILSLAEPKK